MYLAEPSRHTGRLDRPMVSKGNLKLEEGQEDPVQRDNTYQRYKMCVNQEKDLRDNEINQHR